MAFDASAISLREAMDKMSGLPDLPGGARRTILVRALRVQDAPEVLRTIGMRSSGWRGHNTNAVRQMASAYGLLRMLCLSALPARVQNPHDGEGNLAWVRDCEEQLRRCAGQVGGSFAAKAIPLCDDMLHHVSASAHRPLSWIVRDAKALLKRVAKLRESTHTLSEAADPVNDKDEE